jgi:hypothetical protein
MCQAAETLTRAAAIHITAMLEAPTQKIGKRDHGFPEKFRHCGGVQANDARIYRAVNYAEGKLAATVHICYKILRQTCLC